MSYDTYTEDLEGGKKQSPSPQEELIPEEFEKWISTWLYVNVVSGPEEGEMHTAKCVWARAIAIAAYRELSQKAAMGMRERLQERITTLEQKYAAKGFEENYGDIMTRGGIVYLKQVLAWLDETPSIPSKPIQEEKPQLSKEDATIKAIRDFTTRLIAPGPEACRQFLKDAGIETESEEQPAASSPTEVPEEIMQQIGHYIGNQTFTRSNGAQIAAQGMTDMYLRLQEEYSAKIAAVEGILRDTHRERERQQSLNNSCLATIEDQKKANASLQASLSSITSERDKWENKYNDAMRELYRRRAKENGYDDYCDAHGMPYVNECPECAKIQIKP